ncbi:helix-turn-helix domain-containing protein [Nocardiopsis sp. NPDC057823]|uniref:helix-turn-helix domain-containing protein n=1 Tax=Nocardiopsis sp. NPDC057823 TaxID=3346256 RepID=UPI00366DF614
MKTYRFLGAKARRRREEIGLTTRQVATMIGVTAGHVRNLETGNSDISPPTYKLLCGALHVEMDALREEIDDRLDDDGEAA